MKKSIISSLLLIAALAFSIGLQAQNTESYESLMRTGEAKYAAKDYISAKTYFELALKQKTNDPSAKQKLTETLQKIQEDGARQAVFYSHLDNGDALLGQQKYAEALVEYNKALEVFPDDKYVTSQAETVKAVLKERQDKLDAFNLAMEQGENLLASDNFDAAIMQFENAIGIFPDDKLPKERLAEAKKQKGLYNDKMAHFNKLIEEANNLTRRKNYDEAIAKLNQAKEIFPDDEQINTLMQSILASKNQNDRYNTIIAEADRQYENKSYKEAKASYQNALTVIPGDAYANDMIQRINQVFESPEYLAQENYNKAVARGVELETQSQYALALDAFNEALGFKPGDEFATQKISAINEILQLQAQQAELDARFNELMASGDQAEKNKELQQALNFYVDAANLKPDNTAVQNKINAIRGQLQALADAQSSYNDAIAQGDKLFNGKQYEQAITAYNNALSIKPEETYPQQQIEAARQGIADLAALAEQQAKDNRYNEAIAQGDKLFNGKQYEQAITAYNSALSIKPEETYPQQQIEAARQGIAELAALAEQQAQDDRYNEAIAQGDKLFNGKQYEQAITAYNSALSIKPEETYPQQQIEAARQGIADLAAQQALDDSYNSAIADADNLFNSQQYEQAIAGYRNALTIKPGESYPQQQITAAENKMNELALEAEKQAQIQSLLAEADALYNELNYEGAKVKYQEVLTLDHSNVPATEKVREIESYFARIAAENQQKYDDAIRAADQYFNAQDYGKAIGQYQVALSSKPGDTYASERIATAQQLDSERIAALRTQYNTFIKEGDAQFKAKALDRAVENYTKAEELNLGETYPSEMIARISRIIEENKLYELNSDPFTLVANNAQRYTFNPIDIASRRSNYVIIKIRNLNPGKNFPMIVSFGGASGKNGGFVLPISSSELEKTYIFRIGSQYKWFSEDNTWIEFISEKENVEIGLVQISRSN